MIRFFRILLGFGFITAIYTIIFLLSIYPFKPNGAIGWLIFSGLGIPFVFFLEWLVLQRRFRF
jgi:hypothetical protein